MSQKSKNHEKLIENAIRYHTEPRGGKLEIVPTKPLVTQQDLSLAYTPGVAEVCKRIDKDKNEAYSLTTKGNLVMVVTNGTAVLGLGDIGPEASKPVMEGKAVLFKKFANIDVFDIELAEKDPHRLVDIIAAMAPTFGGINLEDIKAPECFIVEEELQKRLDIPVFHDDQHGTAIIALAAFINAMKLTNKKKEKVKIVFSGAGAAGLACVKMLLEYGVPQKNIFITDIEGVVHTERENLADHLKPFAQKTKARTLDDVMDKADVFFGLSAGGVLKKESVKKMAKKPIIFAMANPTPEIMPDEVAEVRDDVIMGTGRSDFPNQVNNVLVFPYIFRGALDCGATTINTAMKIAAAEGIAELARKEADATLDVAYKGKPLTFGPEYIIPKPFDSRLNSIVAPAVAKAAHDSGVASRPIEDLEGYAQNLRTHVDQSFALMRQIFSTAKKDPKRVVYPEADDPRILRAAQTLINEGVCHPVFVGIPDRVKPLIRELGLPMKEDKDFTLINPYKYDKLEEYTPIFYDMRARDGVLPPEAEIILRSRWPSLGAMMLREGDADAMVTGVTGRFQKFLHNTKDIIGLKEGVKDVYALQMLMHKGKVYFIGDTNVHPNPTSEQLAELCALAAEEVKHFGVDPRIALLSHSSFGSHTNESALKMKETLALVKEKHPHLCIEGEMQADTALNMDIMNKTFPNSALKEPANLLIMPNMDAANITFNMMKTILLSAENIGPILLGMNKPVHILSIYSNVRQIVNMSALSVVESTGVRDL